MKKVNVSLCLITKNEQHCLLNCINSVKHLVDEIVVVDTGSSDNTIDLARAAGARVLNFTWTGDFSQARNFCLAQATGQWILVLDSDEVLAPVGLEEFYDLLGNEAAEGYFLHINNYLGNGKEIARDKVVRLFRNKTEYRFTGAIHEQVAPSILKANDGSGLAVAPLVINHYGYLDEEVIKKDKFIRNTLIITRELKNKPNDPLLLYSLALEHYQRNNILEGVQCLKKALAQLRGSEGYFEDVILNTAIGLLQLGWLEELMDFINKSLLMLPEQKDLLLMRKLADQGLKRYLKAADTLEKSIHSRGKESFMKTRVMVASPVKQKEVILKQFLESLNKLEKSELELDFVFIDDNNNHNLLEKFRRGKKNVRIIKATSSDSYICDEETHRWSEELIWKVAAYKNKFIKMAFEEGYDYLFLVDSDLYLHPKTIKHLISLKKDIVSEVFWTRWGSEFKLLPQVWGSDQYDLYHVARGQVLSEGEKIQRIEEFIEKLSKPGTYKVGGLGACTLISKKALSKGVSFSEIYNLSFWGEDRHFCIRAVALGFELYADTYYPPFHIYRESELSELKEYKKKINPVQGKAGKKDITIKHKKIRRKGNKITLAMLVRNEAGRYLERVLEQAKRYADNVVILDDASEDDTVDVCKRVLEGIPLTIVSNKSASFNNEIVLRKQLWQMTVDTNPDWIIILDADELFENNGLETLRILAEREDIYSYSFRLYDMWSETHYREDEYWCSHKWYRTFMIRYVPDFNYRWKETPQHCGRLPVNILDLKGENHPLRIKHLGWLKPEDRIKKYYRYKQLDPHSIYGIAKQYESILDPCPNLVRWVEDNIT